MLILDGAGPPQVAASHGLSESARQLTTCHAPPLGSATRSSESAAALCLVDIERDPEWAPARAVLASEGIRAIAFVPVSYGPRPFGALVSRPPSLSYYGIRDDV